MVKKKNQIEFEQIIERGCGLDVHKSIITSTIKGTGLREETRTYNSFTDSIEEMRDWLKESTLRI